MSTSTSSAKATASTQANKALKGGKKAFDWGWKKLEPVGGWLNAKAGKLGVESVWPMSMPLECEKCARILWTFSKTRSEVFESASGDVNSAKKTQKVIKKIPPEVIAKCQGLAIFTVWRTGLGVSAASGSGVVIARDTPSSFGPPSGILVHTIGFGWLADDVVLVLRTQKAVEAFCKPKISVGAEIAVVAGPVGNGAMLDSGIEAAPVFSYTKSKGLYGGIQLDGNIIIARDDENERFYGRRLKVKELLFGGNVAIPEGANVLHTVIDAAEGKPVDENELPPDIDVAPSDRPTATAPPNPDDPNAPPATEGASAAPPPVPPRRNVPPPPLAQIDLDDPDEVLKKSPASLSSPPPPRPPRRMTPNASPRVSGEAQRSSVEARRVSLEALSLQPTEVDAAAPPAPAAADPFTDKKAVDPFNDEKAVA